MRVTVGTFNLNNLFSRYNFRAEVSELPAAATTLSEETTYQFGEGDTVKFRAYRGSLVTAKDPGDQATIAERVRRIDVDVLAVQEVEDIDTLKQFAREDLGGMYPHVALIEGNDPRLIDLGVLSKLPLGAVTSWRHKVHPDMPNQSVFGRDLLEVEVLAPNRRRKLFTLYNTHKKSQFVPFNEDPVEGKAAADARRKRQAEMTVEIVAARNRPRSRFVVTGDFNDTPEAAPLHPLVVSELGLVDGLAAPRETRPPKADNPPPASARWTHRFKRSGQPADYELFDQIWLSPSLGERLIGGHIDRRTKHGGDGSDHDPAWVELNV